MWECAKSAEQAEKSRKIASPQITAHIFSEASKWNGAKHVTFQPEFPAFPCKWYDPPRFDKKFSFPGAVSNFRGFLAGKDKKFPQVRPMP